MGHSTLASLVTTCREFLADQRGVTAIEYAIIASGISVVVVGSVTLIGGSLSGTFTTTNAGLGG